MSKIYTDEYSKLIDKKFLLLRRLSRISEGHNIEVVSSTRNKLNQINNRINELRESKSHLYKGE